MQVLPEVIGTVQGILWVLNIDILRLQHSAMAGGEFATGFAVAMWVESLVEARNRQHNKTSTEKQRSPFLRFHQLTKAFKMLRRCSFYQNLQRPLRLVMASLSGSALSRAQRNCAH